MPSLGRNRTGNSFHRGGNRISRSARRLSPIEDQRIRQPLITLYFRSNLSTGDDSLRDTVRRRPITGRGDRSLPPLQRESFWSLTIFACLAGEACTLSEFKTLLYIGGIGIIGTSLYLWLRIRRVHRVNTAREQWYRQSFQRQEEIRARTHRPVETTDSSRQAGDRIGGDGTIVPHSPRGGDRALPEGRTGQPCHTGQDRPVPVVRKEQPDPGGDQDVR